MKGGEREFTVDGSEGKDKPERIACGCGFCDL